MRIGAVFFYVLAVLLLLTGLNNLLNVDPDKSKDGAWFAGYGLGAFLFPFLAFLIGRKMSKQADRDERGEDQ
jgi:hypothetical protein